MKECTTENNAELVVNEATFGECLILQSVILAELKKVKLDIGEIDIEKLAAANMSMILDGCKTLFVGLMTSKEFEKAIFNCLKHCTYNDIQITKNLFDDLPEARGDFYQIIKECIEVNLSPFLKSLTSQLTKITATEMIGSQKLNSTDNMTE